MSVFNPEIDFTSDPKQVRESSFQFLERSSWNRCAFIRDLITMWLGEIETDAEFESQIKSKIDKQHDGALFELIVNIFLKRLSFQVEKHPRLTKNKTPDFTAEDMYGGKYFFECTLSENSFENMVEERRKEAVEDIIRGIHYYPYFINLRFKHTGTTSVSAKKLKNFIEQVRAVSEGYSNEQLFHRRFLFEDGDWKIEISLLRKTNQSIKTSLGMVGQDAKIIDGKKVILSALNDKRPSKYGIEDTPYVICICNNDAFFQEEDMYSVLFGNDGSEYINVNYPGNTGFYFHNGPINTSVSAVILFKNTDLMVLNQAKWSVWHNPYAKFPLATNHLPIREYSLLPEENRLRKVVIEKDFNIFSALGIDEDAYNQDPKGSDESC